MKRSHASKERNPLRRVRRAFQTGGFSIIRPPLLDPNRNYRHSSENATYRQAEWGRKVIVEYLRRVRLGLPGAPYPAEPVNGRQP